MNTKVKQRDITDCGAACIASIAAFYQLKIPVSKIRQYAGTDKKGTNVLGLIKAAEKLGFSAKGVRGGMDALPQIPLPAVAHLVVKEVLHHYVVVQKVNKDSLLIMDPADGKLHKKPYAEFEKEWTGVLVLLAPDNDFIPGDHTISNFKRFMFLLQPHKSVLTQALVGAVFYTILGLSTSIYIQKITDFVLVNGNLKLLNLMSIAMLIILAVQILTGVIKSKFMLKTGQKIDIRLILGHYKHLLKLPQRFFDSMRVGEIISRINDAVKIRAFINDTAIAILVNFFIVLFSFSLMFIYSWKLALIMALVIPFYTLTYWIVNRLNKKQERLLMEKSADLESQLVESLNAVKTIKQFGIEDHSNLKTENRFINLLKTVYQSGINSLFSGNASEAISRVFTIVLLWIGSGFVVNKTITPGELLGFYAIIGYFTSPVAGLINMNKTIQNALIAADRLFEIMDLEREDETQKIQLQASKMGDICFRNLSFSYGTRVEVFENFNLTVQKGKMTAIIGESGSGKTTLASLLQQIYPLNKGEILIGETNIRYFDHNSLRQFVSCVPQNLDLFSGNVIDNIALGEMEPDMEKIHHICRKLGLLEFIEKLPAGFNSYLGENGAKISGGQKQRIAIARALYRDPEVLIMDEATSSLDSESELHVHNALHDLIDSGKTVIVIAHRLSTVVQADQIVVLEDGCLVEKGNHDHLYNLRGKYYDMWQKQIPAEIIKTNILSNA